MTTKTIATMLLLLPLAACASLADEARVGFTTSRQKAEVSTTFFGQKYTETVEGESSGVRLELAKRVQPDVAVGFTVNYGEGTMDDVDVRSTGLGAAVRQYMGPVYGEARATYRYDEAALEHTNAVELGAALGVELELSRRLSLFVQGGYDWSFGDQDTGGPSGLIGMAIRL